MGKLDSCGGCLLIKSLTIKILSDVGLIKSILRRRNVFHSIKLENQSLFFKDSESVECRSDKFLVQFGRITSLSNFLLILRTEINTNRLISNGGGGVGKLIQQ